MELMLPRIMVDLSDSAVAEAVSRADMTAWVLVVFRYVQASSIGSRAASIRPKNIVSWLVIRPVALVGSVMGPRYMSLNWEATLT